MVSTDTLPRERTEWFQGDSLEMELERTKDDLAHCSSMIECGMVLRGGGESTATAAAANAAAAAAATAAAASSPLATQKDVDAAAAATSSAASAAAAAAQPSNAIVASVLNLDGWRVRRVMLQQQVEKLSAALARAKQRRLEVAAALPAQRGEPTSLVRLLYVARFTDEFREQGGRAIDEAMSHVTYKTLLSNGHFGVSAFMHYTDTHVFQVLTGAREVIDIVVESVRRDRRIAELRVLTRRRPPSVVLRRVSIGGSPPAQRPSRRRASKARHSLVDATVDGYPTLPSEGSRASPASAPFVDLLCAKLLLLLPFAHGRLPAGAAGAASALRTVDARPGSPQLTPGRRRTMRASFDVGVGDASPVGPGSPTGALSGSPVGSPTTSSARLQQRAERFSVLLAGGAASRAPGARLRSSLVRRSQLMAFAAGSAAGSRNAKAAEAAAAAARRGGATDDLRVILAVAPYGFAANLSHIDPSFYCSVLSVLHELVTKQGGRAVVAHGASLCFSFEACASRYVVATCHALLTDLAEYAARRRRDQPSVWGGDEFLALRPVLGAHLGKVTLVRCGDAGSGQVFSAPVGRAVAVAQQLLGHAGGRYSVVVSPELAEGLAATADTTLTPIRDHHQRDGVVAYGVSAVVPPVAAAAAALSAPASPAAAGGGGGGRGAGSPSAVMAAAAAVRSLEPDESVRLAALARHTREVVGSPKHGPTSAAAAAGEGAVPAAQPYDLKPDSDGVLRPSAQPMWTRPAHLCSEGGDPFPLSEVELRHLFDELDADEVGAVSRPYLEKYVGMAWENMGLPEAAVRTRVAGVLEGCGLTDDQVPFEAFSMVILRLAQL